MASERPSLSARPPFTDRTPSFPCRPIRRAAGAAASTFTGSRPSFAAISLQGAIEAFDQSRCGEGLGQESNCPGFQRPAADALIGQGRDVTERYAVALGAPRR